MGYSLATKSHLLRILSSPIVKILEGSLFLALLAKIALPLPFTPILVTFQTLGIFCIGIAYSPRMAVGSVLSYLVAGIFLPVFYGSGCGLTAFFGPTAGYLYAFPIAALFISSLYRRFKSPSGYVLASILTIAALIILVMGSLWLSYYFYMMSLTESIDVVKGFQLGAMPFIVGEALKILLVVKGKSAVQFFQKHYF
ncbi:biotin transporter BioY [Chlamydia psittaci]|uniref:biotin transporter BioY n=1 Tax=Chlamydia psittaci TaxID=83554 RepID=UPI00027E58ED|nr:biotin transporter BioY [Chlamydia psittaci]AFS28260.1 bioY family protein [Chlamydia psittaci NJ1]KPZ36102.1 biotin biosynthesis protein BioY [Chlamydia psittaci NJ1]MDS0919287.1 biotin transporter BioY [Chlamydia psittaci]MDS0989318.1 biotin transporter BioY [Chlamydia psittaci]MDS0995293.1 biotin transporter BioY [Chlamydia psittaci]